MLKKLLAAVLMAPLMALAQTYPSPTLSKFTAPATGQFYSNAGASVSRIYDRLFVGPAAQNLGTNVAAQPDWLTTYQIAKGRTYGYVQTSQMAVLNGLASQDSLTTFVAGAQTTGRTGGSQVIAVTGMGVNNNSTGNAANAAWAGYFEAFRDTGTGGNGGAYGIEIDTMNFVGSTPVTDPYSQANDQTVGMQLASGGGFPGTLYPTTVGLNFQNNNTTYDKGIVFGSNAITGATGSSGTGIAIALGLGHQLQWYGAAGVKTSSITGNGTTSAAGVGEVFSDNKVQWLNVGGNPVFSLVGVSSGVNALQALGAATGQNPQLAAIGTDTNIGVQLTPKGSGSVVANGPLSVSGAATINTLSSSGATITGGAISGTPISGSTGSFTTLAASSTVSGAGFTSLLSPYALLASPTFTGTPAAPTASAATSTTQIATTAMVNSAVTGNNLAGSFTTLNASGNDALTYENTNAQSISNNSATTVTTWTKSFDRLNANFNASTGTFTAPATGYYHVDAGLLYAAATASVVNEAFEVIVVGNGTTLCTGQARSQQIVSSVGYAATTSCLVSLTSGQTIVVQAFQNSGSAVALATVAGGNYVSINRVP